jgi:5-methylcytosine-specific restriction protein A
VPIVELCHCGARCKPGKTRCPDHQRRDSRPSARKRGYDTRHEADRATYLKEHPFCEDPYHEGCERKATVLDHIDGMGPLGPFGHDRENWMALCASCHGRKTAEQTPGGWNAGATPDGPTSPFVVLIGESGTGKTAVRDYLAEYLRVATFGPDDFTSGWDGVWPGLDAAARAVVECVALHSQLRRRVRDRNAVLVRLEAESYVRRDRLNERGETDAWVRKLLEPAGYGEDVPPDLTVDTTARSPSETATVVGEWISERLGWALHR